MTPTVFAIEGLDRTGKSTLIQGIQDKLGFYQVIHFAKPQKLKIYEDAAKKPAYQGDGGIEDVPPEHRAAYFYQRESFLNSMLLANSNARIIFDRWHIGEVVYSPMYRGYSGDYVYQQELNSGLDKNPNVRLILLIEDFATAKHFVDDGQSLGPIEKREEEQSRFIAAFKRSNIKDKRMVVITNSKTGGFHSKEAILEHALS